MLLMTEYDLILNFKYIVTIWIDEAFRGNGYVVKCDLESEDEYIIKSCKTEQEAKETLEQILSQCNRGQRVIRIK